MDVDFKGGIIEDMANAGDYRANIKMDNVHVGGSVLKLLLLWELMFVR